MGLQGEPGFYCVYGGGLLKIVTPPPGGNRIVFVLEQLLCLAGEGYVVRM